MCGKSNGAALIPSNSMGLDDHHFVGVNEMIKEDSSADGRRRWEVARRLPFGDNLSGLCQLFRIA